MASPMKSEPQPAGLKDDGSAPEKKPSLDSQYHFDEKKLQNFRKEAPWTKDPKYFTSCSISPSAVMKMMMHCESGVRKGIDKGGNPIEVMGLLMGRPDYDTPKTLVITDAFPLPIEGFETRVIADDEDVVNHMIALGECLERTRKEKFMGWYVEYTRLMLKMTCLLVCLCIRHAWTCINTVLTRPLLVSLFRAYYCRYHSHPFDLGDHSHCFLSQTDLSTQLQWQRAEDPHGNPFVAIVLDPLRSIHRSTPELKAFRAYPPEYNSPIANECPNGSVEPSEQTRLEHWGSCWNRYYELNVEYYMSSTARDILEQLTQDYLWIRTLGGKGTTKEEQEELPSRIRKTAEQFNAAAGSSASSKPMATVFGSGRGVQVDSSITGTSAAMTRTDEMGMDKAVKQIVEMASAQIDTELLQNAKQKVFAPAK